MFQVATTPFLFDDRLLQVRLNAAPILFLKLLKPVVAC